MFSGDSGYPLREYLMTPIDNASEDSPEGRYNMAHKRTRSVVERTFGILKGRWRCLLAARELHYRPQKAAHITIACVVLHNLCIQGGLAAPELSPEELQEEISQQMSATAPPVSAAQGLLQGRRARDAIVQLLNRNR